MSLLHSLRWINEGLVQPVSTYGLPSWLGSLTPCSACSRQLPYAAGQVRGTKSSTRKVEVIMLQDVEHMKLKKHFVEKVKPGTARNYLVPNKLAIYAHYLNKQEWRGAIEAAMKAAPLTDSDDAKRIAKRERTIVKRLQNLTLKVEVLSDDGKFLAPYKVADIPKLILHRHNIVVHEDLILLDQDSFSEPGTYDIPLALLNEKDNQVIPVLQLAPMQATPEQLKARGYTPKEVADTDED